MLSIKYQILVPTEYEKKSPAPPTYGLAQLKRRFPAIISFIFRAIWWGRLLFKNKFGKEAFLS